MITTLQKYCILSLVVIIYFTVNSPALKLEFSDIDDGWMLLQYELVYPKEYSFNWLFEVFTTYNGATYSPLITLYFHLLHLINGLDPYYFHLGSLFFQVINGLLICKMSHKILSDFDFKNYEALSIAVGVIWIFHPLHVEAVSWISAVKFGLSNMFVLIGFLYYINGINSGLRIYYIISAVCIIFGCLAKEQAIFSPYLYASYGISLLLYKNKRLEKAFLIGTTIVWLSSLLFVYINIVCAYYGPTPAGAYSLYDRFHFASSSILFYVSKAIFPYPLEHYYGFPMEPDESLPTYYLYTPYLVLIIFSIAGYIYYKIRRIHFYMFCVSFFMVKIFMCLQLYPMGVRSNLVAARYMYLPLIPIIYILLGLLPFEKLRFPYVISLVILYVIGLASYTYLYTETWSKLNLFSL